MCGNDGDTSLLGKKSARRAQVSGSIAWLLTAERYRLLWGNLALSLHLRIALKPRAVSLSYVKFCYWIARR